MAFFEATKEFDSALCEIDHLISVAKVELPSSHRFSTNLKAAIILLASKLEAYVENVVEEYVDCISVARPKSKYLPKKLRDHSSTFMLSKVSSNVPFSSKRDHINAVLAAANLWCDEEEVPKIKVNGKFNYGKHGSTELKSLFERAGVEDIFGKCLVTTTNSESMLDESSKRSVSGDIDSLTGIRNNIIHSDASPSNLTADDIKRYRDSIWEFGYQIDLLLQRELYGLQAKIAANV